MTTVNVIGGFWSPLHMMLSLACCFVTRRIEPRRPRMLVIRSFGDDATEAYLRAVTADLGREVRPLWLHDSSNPMYVRHHLPSSRLWVASLFVWAALGLVVLADQNMHATLPARVLWIAWMVVGTSAYHRYQAGARASYWIGCVGGVLATLGIAPLLLPRRLNEVSWQDAREVAGIFAAAWLLLGVLVEVGPIRRLFRPLLERRRVRDDRDLKRFVREARSELRFPRYLPYAPTHLDEVVCDKSIWAATVHHAFDVVSIALADITGAEKSPRLRWELEQARAAGIPIVITCRTANLDRALSAPGLEWLAGENIAQWSNGRWPIGRLAFQYQHTRTAFNEKVRAHASTSLADLQPRPTRDEALARLRDLETRG